MFPQCVCVALLCCECVCVCRAVWDRQLRGLVYLRRWALIVHEGEKSIGLGSFGDKPGLRCRRGHLLSPWARLGIYHSVTEEGSHSRV